MSNIVKTAFITFVYGTSLSLVAQPTDDFVVLKHSNKQLQQIIQDAPEIVNEYVLLKQDIDRLSAKLYHAETRFAEQMQAYRAYQNKSDNKYNQSEKFKLFRQLDNQEYYQQVRKSEYELKRVREKLYSSLLTFEDKSDEIDKLFIKKNAVADEEVIERLLAGQPVVLSEKQKPIAINLLFANQSNPKVFAKLIVHQNIAEMLPDYIRQQLAVFGSNDIPLEKALSNSEVMAAVIAKIKAIDAVQQVIPEKIGVSIYSQKEAPKVLNFIAPPVYLAKDLNVEAVTLLQAVDLYELPLPSEELVLKLAELRGSEANLSDVISFSSLTSDLD